ncbi:MAG TPA: DUF1634 domain-containing protein [Sediminibacterium sp.]
MKTAKQPLRDRDVERIMGNLLRYGVLASSMIVFTGAVVYLAQHAQDAPHYTHFEGEPSGLKTLGDTWRSAWQGNGLAIIQAGLFVLIATPVARIIFSIISYLLEKDYLYLLITGTVLAIILCNL